MNFVNKKVTHWKFGEGHVVQVNESSVEVAFGEERKKFVYPDAFGKYLTLHDEQAAGFIANILQKKEIEEEQRKLESEEEIQRQREKDQLHTEHKKLLNNRKIHPQSQVVFWCDEEEENTIFTDWQIFAGVIKSGKNKGAPRKLSRLQPNSACLLTVRGAKEPEKERRIIGVYMVKEEFVGKHCEDGYIPAHSKYRLQLTKEESEKLLFWTYYSSDKQPDKIAWNSGKTRYFDNLWMAQILRDLVSLKTDPHERALAKEFFEYFCKMNQILREEIPEPNGALTLHKESVLN